MTGLAEPVCQITQHHRSRPVQFRDREPLVTAVAAAARHRAVSKYPFGCALPQVRTPGGRQAFVLLKALDEPSGPFVVSGVMVLKSGGELVHQDCPLIADIRETKAESVTTRSLHRRCGPGHEVDRQVRRSAGSKRTARLNPRTAHCCGFRQQVDVDGSVTGAIARTESRRHRVEHTPHKLRVGKVTLVVVHGIAVAQKFGTASASSFSSTSASVTASSSPGPASGSSGPASTSASSLSSTSASGSSSFTSASTSAAAAASATASGSASRSASASLASDDSSGRIVVDRVGAEIQVRIHAIGIPDRSPVKQQRIRGNTDPVVVPVVALYGVAERSKGPGRRVRVGGRISGCRSDCQRQLWVAGHDYRLAETEPYGYLLTGTVGITASWPDVEGDTRHDRPLSLSRCVRAALRRHPFRVGWNRGEHRSGVPKRHGAEVNAAWRLDLNHPAGTRRIGDHFIEERRVTRFGPAR